MVVDSWIRPAERVILELSGQRVIGLMGIEPKSGVTSFASTIAALLARGGRKTLLLDLTLPIQEQPQSLPSPGATPPSHAFNHVLAGPQYNPGYDYVGLKFSSSARFSFANVEAVRSLFLDEFKEYEKILVDIPPVSELENNKIYSLPPAAACDKMYLVALPGYTTAERFQSVIQLFSSAGVEISGLILNEMHQHVTGKKSMSLA